MFRLEQIEESFENTITRYGVLLGHEQIATTLMYCRVNDSTVKSSHRKYLG